MKREHRECLFDICNFCGRNGGAWADQWGDDVVTFGGAWHGDDASNPPNSTAWMPGSYAPFNDERRTYMAYNVRFAVQGDISNIVKRFARDWLPRPQDFKGLTIYARLEDVP